MAINDTDEKLRPVVAPCADIQFTAPLRWLALGWRDYKNTPKTSALYGLAVVIISYLVFIVSWTFNSITLAIGMLSAFIFIAPVLCIGLYSISRQLQQQKQINFIQSIQQGFKPYGDLSIFIIVIIVVSLIWARAASMIHIFFPVGSENNYTDLLIFLGIGSCVGTLFAIIIFSISAFSLPMVMDKEVDMITACMSSINVVIRNKTTMLFWSMLIVLLTAIGIVTAFLGFLVTIPWLGYATWHGYKECLDVADWDDRITEN